MHYQQTLQRPARCSGIGVHSGRPVNLTIKPAAENFGIRFKRIDAAEPCLIPAHFSRVVDTSMATVIGYDDGDCIVSTIEHLMAAFVGMGIDNALVEMDDYEVPILDGSAAGFAAVFEAAGVAVQAAPRCIFKVRETICLEDGDKSVRIEPYPYSRITCSIAYPHCLIGDQTYSITLERQAFVDEIAPARTFGFYDQYEALKRVALSRGCSLDNVVVIGDDGIMNPGGLRFDDEFVRHKVLDTIGDFALLGMPVMGHIITRKSGHQFNHAFLKTFFSAKKSWETHMLRAPVDADGIQSRLTAGLPAAC